MIVLAKDICQDEKKLQSIGISRVRIKKIIKENTTGKSGGFGDADDQAKKDKQAFSDVKDKVTLFDKGNVGEVNAFTSAQMGNVRQLATDPTGFIIQTFMKKFAKGVGVIALALMKVAI